MQLEVGKKYKTRAGWDVEIDSPADPGLWAGWLNNGSDVDSFVFRDDGWCLYMGPEYQITECVTEDAAPAPKTCPKTYRIKTEKEAGTEDPTLRHFGGRTPDNVIPSPSQGDPRMYVFLEKVTLEVLPHWLEEITAHDFPNTGGQRSWCRHCDAVGHWDWRAGQFKVII